MENENELAIIQLKTDVLKQQSDDIKAAQLQMSERFNAMAKFVKEGFEKIQNQFLANQETDDKQRVYLLYPSKSEDISLISKALSSAKAEIGSITKATPGQRSGFASLTDMFEICDPVMLKYEISTTFGISQNEYGENVLIGVLAHSSGQWFEYRTLLRENTIPDKIIGSYHQRIAASEKPLRRYMYRAMLNLADTSD